MEEEERHLGWCVRAKDGCPLELPEEVFKLVIPSKVVLGQLDSITKTVTLTPPHTICEINSADLIMDPNTQYNLYKMI